MKRGEIWWADLGDNPIGSSPGYLRPVLVVQSDLLNKSQLSTCIVVSLTTNLNHARAVGNVPIRARESGLPKDSVIVVAQLSAIDRTQFVEKISCVPDTILFSVDEGLRTVLDL